MGQAVAAKTLWYSYPKRKGEPGIFVAHPIVRLVPLAYRSKVRISPAFAPMGPRFTFPHQVGAYIGGGSLQHVRHYINVVAARQGNYILPYWATA